MEVIIISERKQQFNGKHYWCGKGKNRYYRRVHRGKSYYIHREVWLYYYKSIPKGYHIHHIDNNWHNNQIDNLQALPVSAHMKIQTPEALENRRRNIAKVGHLAKAWHKSEAGHKWHSEHSKKGWENRKTYTKNCENCDGKYSTPFPSRSKYCGGNCKATAFRRSRDIMQKT